MRNTTTKVVIIIIMVIFINGCFIIWKLPEINQLQYPKIDYGAIDGTKARLNNVNFQDSIFIDSLEFD